MNKNQCFEKNLKETIIKTIGKDRAFMDVPDVVEEIVQNILPIIEQYKTSKVIITVSGGVADVQEATPGTTVIIKDYDVEGEDETRFKEDEEGFYAESTYEF